MLARALLSAAAMLGAVLGANPIVHPNASNFAKWISDFEVQPYTSAADRAKRFEIWAERISRLGYNGLDPFADLTGVERKAKLTYRRNYSLGYEEDYGHGDHSRASAGSDHPCRDQQTNPTNGTGGNTLCGCMIDGSDPLVLACAGNGTITAVTYASVGNPTGTCGSYTDGSCKGSATKAKDVVTAACVGKSTCSLTADIGHMDGGKDPCTGVEKRVAVEVTCSTPQPVAPAPPPWHPPVPPPQPPYHPPNTPGCPQNCNYPWKKFPQAYIDKALKDGAQGSAGVDWRRNGAVTVPKGQTGGNCGTWGRVGCAESSYALGGGGAGWPNGKPVNKLTNFSEQQMLDCTPAHTPQATQFYTVGFMRLSDYPTNHTNHGKPHFSPCLLDKSKVIPGSKFTNRTQAAHNPDSMAAFIHYNGPVQGGKPCDHG